MEMREYVLVAIPTIPALIALVRTFLKSKKVKALEKKHEDIVGFQEIIDANSKYRKEIKLELDQAKINYEILFEKERKCQDSCRELNYKVSELTILLKELKAKIKNLEEKVDNNKGNSHE